MLHAQGQHCTSRRSFTRYTQLYVNPVIRSLHFSIKQTIFSALHDCDLVLLGDMQYMSMGHTRGNSPTLELYGFLRALYHVVSAGLTVSRVVTDEHTQIKNFFSK